MHSKIRSITNLIYVPAIWASAYNATAHRVLERSRGVPEIRNTVMQARPRTQTPYPSRNPHHLSDVVAQQDHQPQRQQRADECADGIKSLTKSVGGSPHIRWCQPGYQRIARRTADTFTNAIDKAGREYSVD